MSFKQTKTECAALGFRLTRTEYDEYRLCRQGGGEAGAYYTDDLEDALGTARAEHRRVTRMLEQAASLERDARFLLTGTSVQSAWLAEAAALRGMAMEAR